MQPMRSSCHNPRSERLYHNLLGHETEVELVILMCQVPRGCCELQCLCSVCQCQSQSIALTGQDDQRMRWQEQRYHCQRIDAIWDTYPEQNLKSLTQQRRGSGTRTLLKPDGDGNTPIPKRGWQSYLKNVGNKQELFSFISRQLAETDFDGKLLLSTKFEKVLSNKPFSVSEIQPCNHTEADSRIILHLAHVLSQGHDKAFVCTVDSDVIAMETAGGSYQH